MLEITISGLNGDPRLLSLYALADQSSTLRDAPLRITSDPTFPLGVVEFNESDTHVKTSVAPGESDWVHHMAHELSHVIAGACGLSLRTIWTDDLYCDDIDPKRDVQALDARNVINTACDSLCHVAVHSLLAAAGFEESNWDQYLIDQLEAEAAPKFYVPAYEVIRALWIVQFRNLELRNLPGLDTRSLTEAIQRNCKAVDLFVDDFVNMGSVGAGFRS